MTYRCGDAVRLDDGRRGILVHCSKTYAVVKFKTPESYEQVSYHMMKFVGSEYGYK